MIDGILRSGGETMLASELFWMLFVVFLPIYGLVYRRKTVMVVFVLAFSLLFCYMSSGWLVALLAGRAVVDYLLSLVMRRSRSHSARRFVLILSLVLSVGALVCFKYGDFIILNINELTAANFRLMNLIVPLGISFYTFRSVSYMVEVYRGTVEVPKSILDYALYLSFFPALIAGPIARPGAFLPQIRENRRVAEHEVYSGLWLVMKGLVKKAVIADYVAQYNNIVFSNIGGYSGAELLLGVLGFGVQIYFDFSGYSDMAIGIARSLGFDLGENFRSPYKSLNIADFWRRWHISLSSWLRDYIYIPLGGNRHGNLRMALGLMVTMTVGGIWHGAGWNFLIWGAAHGIGLVAYKLVGRRVPPLPWRWLNGLIYGFLTFAFVNVLWIFFRTGNLHEAHTVVTAIFTDVDFAYFGAIWAERRLWCVVMALSYVLIFMPASVSARAECAFLKSSWAVKLILFCAVVQCALEMSGEYVAPFLYARF